jgi:NAD(P)-dependent dehydrogenase (short-subunit alcohol dehydrogenase family)
MSSRLAGKVAVITGAGSGIGAAIARKYVLHGAEVVAADISGNEAALAAELGASCLSVHADMTKSADVQSMLDLAIQRFGRLDILCNNAGIGGARALTADVAEEDYDLIWAVNARGVFLGMRNAIPLMLRTGGGSIVNTASMASLVAFPEMVGYCAAKGAVLMMTKTTAVEYARKGIRVNAICPGVVRTGLTARVSQELLDAASQATPMGRIAEASEVADLAVFLGSDESSFITGTSVVIDGGYTAV